tara:strand:- start:4 stop:228 length:225 start_codon:yes stop_codon:yes gene_type:complete
MFYITIKQSFAPHKTYYLNTMWKPHPIFLAYYKTKEEAIEAAAIAGLDDEKYDPMEGLYTIKWSIETETNDYVN